MVLRARLPAAETTRRLWSNIHEASPRTARQKNVIAAARAAATWGVFTWLHRDGTLHIIYYCEMLCPPSCFQRHRDLWGLYMNVSRQYVQYTIKAYYCKMLCPPSCFKHWSDKLVFCFLHAEQIGKRILFKTIIGNLR